MDFFFTKMSFIYFLLDYIYRSTNINEGSSTRFENAVLNCYNLTSRIIFSEILSL